MTANSRRHKLGRHQIAWIAIGQNIVFMITLQLGFFVVVKNECVAAMCTTVDLRLGGDDTAMCYF